MLKMLAISASVLSLAGSFAFAESPNTTGRSVATPSMLSNVYKASVYDPSEKKAGTVKDLMIESDGKVSGAIISVGSIPGITQKDIVVPFEALKVSTRDGKTWVVIDRTQEEIKLAPAYNDTGLPSEYRSPGGDIR